MNKGELRQQRKQARAAGLPFKTANQKPKRIQPIRRQARTVKSWGEWYQRYGGTERDSD
jgi:hypothetical protein